MRILNQTDDAPLDNICVYLTRAEAQAMVGYLEQLIAEPEEGHCHLNDDGYEREITLAVYDVDSLDQYDERSKTLIQTGA